MAIEEDIPASMRSTSKTRSEFGEGGNETYFEDNVENITVIPCCMDATISSIDKTNSFLLGDPDASVFDVDKLGLVYKAGSSDLRIAEQKFIVDYNENFSGSIYKDAGSTTADWVVGSYLLFNNSSLGSDGHGITFGSVTTDPGTQGMKILVGSSSLYLDSIEKDPLCTATKARLRLTYNGADIAVVSFVGVWAIFDTPPTLNAFTNYYLMADTSDDDYYVPYQPGITSYPISNTDDISWIAAARETTGDDTTFAINIGSIYYTSWSGSSDLQMQTTNVGSEYDIRLSTTKFNRAKISVLGEKLGTIRIYATANGSNFQLVDNKIETILDNPGSVLKIKLIDNQATVTHIQSTFKQDDI